MRASLRDLGQLLADLLFPPRCAGCRQPGHLLCSTCEAAIARFPPPCCPRCDLPLAAPAPRCAPCHRGQLADLDGMRVLGPHVAPLREAVHALKYGGRRALGEVLGNRLAAHWQARPGGPLDGLIPVPLHAERQRDRGYNQAEVLAEGMAPRLRLPVRAALLCRRRATPQQVGLDRQARLQNVAGAFVATPGVAGGRWLLVDDVCTTGATLDACAAALRAAGAESVWAITLARPTPDLPRR